MSEVQFDDLPELGTKAAAVESCASLIFYAVNGDKPVEAVQLRYWLDLYYQVRYSAECELRRSEALDRFLKDATPHQPAAPTASPQGEAGPSRGPAPTEKRAAGGPPFSEN